MIEMKIEGKRSFSARSFRISDVDLNLCCASEEITGKFDGMCIWGKFGGLEPCWSLDCNVWYFDKALLSVHGEFFGSWAMKSPKNILDIIHFLNPNFWFFAHSMTNCPQEQSKRY
jgi:hypothetical protein